MLDYGKWKAKVRHLERTLCLECHYFDVYILISTKSEKQSIIYNILGVWIWL